MVASVVLSGLCPVCWVGVGGGGGGAGGTSAWGNGQGLSTIVTAHYHCRLVVLGRIGFGVSPGLAMPGSLAAIVIPGGGTELGFYSLTARSMPSVNVCGSPDRLILLSRWLRALGHALSSHLPAWRANPALSPVAFP